jgi:hypothetical protein
LRLNPLLEAVCCHAAERKGGEKLAQLLEFLFSNFYFFIILIGLLYTMFFRKSPLEKPENRPGRQTMDRSDRLPPRRPGSHPSHRPGGHPANRPVGQPEGPFGPADRMPDFGGSPIFPPKPARRIESRPRPVLEEEPSAPERRQMMPDPWEPDAFPEQRGPIPVPVYTLPEQPAEADVPLSRSQSQTDLAAANASTSYNYFSAADDTVSPVYSAAEKPAPASSSQVSLSGDDLVRAVVWSEILGPPRARRPFRR